MHTDHATSHPRRLIGPLQASSVVVGMVVGAGIFRSASVVSATLTTPAAIYGAWALGGVIAVIGALVYAELCSSFPHQGGDYRFLGEAYGPTVAFLFAWSRFTVIFTASAAMLAFVGTDYLSEIVPMAPPVRALVAAAVVVALSLVNLRGLKTSARSEVVFVAIDVLALLALGGVAIWWTASAAPPAGPIVPAAPASGGFGVAMVYVMLAYGGFNDAATLSAEVRRPRDITRAMIAGMTAVTALYLLANWAYVRVLGAGGLAVSAAPAADVMRALFGRTGQTVMVATVGIATIAVLNALLLVGGRTLYAAAADLPGLERLAVWDEALGVPRAAILLQTALTLLLIGWGSLAPAGFAAMVDYMSPVYWLFLTLSALALPVLRRSRPDVARPYRVPFGPALALVFAGASAYILCASIAYVGWTGTAISFGALVIGLVLRWALRLRAGAARQSLRSDSA